MQRGFP